jgi:hypothetical protein
MAITIRVAGAVLLLAASGVCVFLSVAAREAPRESWWAFWTIYAVVGSGGAVAALWLLRRSWKHPRSTSHVKRVPSSSSELVFGGAGAP